MRPCGTFSRGKNQRKAALAGILRPNGAKSTRLSRGIRPLRCCNTPSLDGSASGHAIPGVRLRQVIRLRHKSNSTSCLPESGNENALPPVPHGKSTRQPPNPRKDPGVRWNQMVIPALLGVNWRAQDPAALTEEEAVLLARVLSQILPTVTGMGTRTNALIRRLAIQVKCEWESRLSAFHSTTTMRTVRGPSSASHK